MTKRIKLSPDAKQNAYEQRERAFTKRDFVVLKRRTDEFGALETRISEAELKITADAITSTVETQIGGTLLNQTQIEQRDSSVLTSAKNYTDGELTDYATLTVLSNQIATRVATTDYNGNTIASLINQTATTVAISASKINLTGYVTLTNLSTAGQTTINGGNITTGTINANNVSVTNLNADNITAGTLNVNRIPNLNADKITVGVLHANRIPTITADKISVTDLSALGASIAGFNIGSYPSYTGNAIYSGSGSSRVGMSPGVTTGGFTYVFWAGANNPVDAPFRVLQNGGLRASGAVISGQITATSGSFTGSIYSASGTIGGANFTSGTNLLNLSGTLQASQVLTTSGSISVRASSALNYFSVWVGSQQYRMWIGTADGVLVLRATAV